MRRFLILAICFCGALYGYAQQVVGGNYVTHGDYPWIVSLNAQGQPLCGAALIAPQWVLTAGHCGSGFPPVIPQPDEVVVNLFSRNNPNSDAEVIAIDSIFVHPDFSITNGNGPDIALIKLASPASQMPVSLPLSTDQHFYNTGNSCKVLGWGSINSTGTPSDTLKEADVYITNFDTCKANYAASSNPIPAGDFYICAGYFKDSTAAGAGAGDSGGPLFVWDNHQWKHIGIVSRGNGIITTDEYPGLFTRTVNFVTWIDSIISANTISGIALSDNDVPRVVIRGNRIEASVPAGSDIPIITVFDLLGREVASKKEYHLNIDQLETGIYLVTVQSEHRAVSKKFYAP